MFTPVMNLVLVQLGLFRCVQETTACKNEDFQFAETARYDSHKLHIFHSKQSSTTLCPMANVIQLRSSSVDGRLQETTIKIDESE